MTLIVGVIDQETGDVWMGSDSAACADNQMDLLAIPKHFRTGRRGEFLIGCAGTIRLTQALQFHFVPPDHDGQTKSDYQYMVQDFIPAVRKCLREQEYLDSSSGAPKVDGVILVAYKGALYEIQDGWQLSMNQLPFTVIGSAYPNAYGALWALQSTDFHAQQRVKIALEAGARFVMDVAPPFQIEKL